jgi:hypothetical protein
MLEKIVRQAVRDEVKAAQKVSLKNRVKLTKAVSTEERRPEDLVGGRL